MLMTLAPLPSVVWAMVTSAVTLWLRIATVAPVAVTCTNGPAGRPAAGAAVGLMARPNVPVKDSPGTLARGRLTAIDPARPSGDSSRTAGADVWTAVRTGLPAVPPKPAVRLARVTSATV